MRAQQKHDAAAMVEKEFERAWEKSDVTLRLEWL